jgi:hypothetical protein
VDVLPARQDHSSRCHVHSWFDDLVLENRADSSTCSHRTETHGNVRQFIAKIVLNRPDTFKVCHVHTIKAVECTHPMAGVITNT